MPGKPPEGTKGIGGSIPNKPRQSATADGSTNLRQYRVRPTWFGLAIVEELWETHDGTRHWRKIMFPVGISKATGAA